MKYSAVVRVEFVTVVEVDATNEEEAKSAIHEEIEQMRFSGDAADDINIGCIG